MKLILFPLVLLTTSCGLTMTPNEVRNYNRSTKVELSKQPHEAAYCIQEQMEEQIRLGLLGRAWHHEVRLRGPNASVLQKAEMGITGWLVDLTPSENGGSTAAFFIGNQYPTRTAKITEMAVSAIKACQ